jgi:hypothetical protein
MTVRYADSVPRFPGSHRTMTFHLRYDARAQVYFWLD